MAKARLGDGNFNVLDDDRTTCKKARPFFGGKVVERSTDAFRFSEAVTSGLGFSNVQ